MGTSDKFNIILSKSAYKYLQRLPQNIRKRIATIIEEELSQDPFSSSKIKPLHGKLEGFIDTKKVI
jgi:mRNA interferase RelE/StbE